MSTDPTSLNLVTESVTGEIIRATIIRFTELREVAKTPEKMQWIDHKLGVFVGPMMIHYNLAVASCAQLGTSGLPKEWIANYFDLAAGYGWVITSLNLIPAHILLAAIDSAVVEEDHKKMLTEQLDAAVAPVNVVLAHILIMAEKVRKELARSIIAEFYLHMEEFLE